MSECRWERELCRYGNAANSTPDSPLCGQSYCKKPNLEPGNPEGMYHPHHLDDGTPCGGAECKDRRSYPWEYRPRGYRVNALGMAINEERRAPGQITDRRAAKGERRKYLIGRMSVLPNSRRTVRSLKDRRQPKAAPADPRGPLRHDTDSGSCECGAWHEKDKPAEGIVERLRNGATRYSGLYTTPNTRLMLEAATHIEQQAAEIQRLRKACADTEHEVQQILGKALGYPWFKDDLAAFPGAVEADGVCVGDHVAATLAAEAVGEIRRLRERAQAVVDWGEPPASLQGYRDSTLARFHADWAALVSILTPKELNGAEQEAE